MSCHASVILASNVLLIAAAGDDILESNLTVTVPEFTGVSLLHLKSVPLQHNQVAFQTAGQALVWVLCRVQQHAGLLLCPSWV